MFGLGVHECSKGHKQLSSGSCRTVVGHKTVCSGCGKEISSTVGLFPPKSLCCNEKAYEVAILCEEPTHAKD